MSIEERWTPPVEGWPSATELERLGDIADLVLLPDRVDTKPDGLTIAAFREDAQAFRVDALHQELRVELVHPREAEVAAYREHAAEWVLPYILGIPTSVVVGLVINRLQKWMDERGDASGTPTVRYREARIVEQEVRVREIEGPADEVVALLRASTSEEDLGHGGTPQIEAES